MKRLSQRGWGFFITEELDLEKGTAKVRLENSAFVYQYGKVNRKVDYYVYWLVCWRNGSNCCHVRLLSENRCTANTMCPPKRVAMLVTLK